jgi:hypothetical protein
MLKSNNEIKEIARAEIDELIRSCDVNPRDVDRLVYESMKITYTWGYRRGRKDERENPTREG